MEGTNDGRRDLVCNGGTLGDERTFLVFDGVAGDNRRLLGWPGRFPSVLDVAVNFYSTGDEALELVSESGIMVWSGLYTNGWDVAHHCWHKQEMFKGRAHLTRGLGGTNWAGWGFNTNLPGYLTSTGISYA